ncbi:MAG: DUF3179 domain-containing protein [Acidimicrobiales bacterium]
MTRDAKAGARWWLWLGVAAVTLAAGCSSAGGGRAAAPEADSPSPSVPESAPSTPVTEPSRSFAVPQVPASGREQVPQALVPSEIPDYPTEIRFNDPTFPPSLVTSDDLQPGGPGPDGIPSIDEPRFLAIADVDFLEDREPVLVFALGDEVRAYPLQIMVWHEIVNDTVDGVPVAVTYCPLSNSAVAHDRRHEGRVLELGVSGALWNSSLVMFDRQTFSLWSHFTGEGLVGIFAGDRLSSFPVSVASWAEFRDAHPDGIVLSRDTGFTRDYGRNPYPGYDDVTTPPFLFEGREIDGRFAAKTRIVGMDLPSGPRAVTNERLEQDRVVSVVDGERRLVVWWQPGTVSALEGRTVASGRDVGTTGVFEAALDGQALSFEALEGGFRDRETGSTWSPLGVATAGPLAGRQLTAVPHVDTFWFAWSAFQPDTEVVA